MVKPVEKGAWSPSDTAMMTSPAAVMPTKVLEAMLLL